MSDALYVSRATIENPGRLHRRARLATGEVADLGVHGPIRAFYRLEPDRERPLPVDYVVAAAGG